MHSERGGKWVAIIAVPLLSLALFAGACSSSPPDVVEGYEWVLDDDFLQIRDCRLLEGLINDEVDRIVSAGDDANLVQAAEIQFQRIVAHRDDVCGVD